MRRVPRNEADEGPEREVLRSMLRQWEAPPTPQGIEEDLRRTVRRLRPSRHRVPWPLLVAATLVVAVLPLLRTDQLAPSTPARPMKGREAPPVTAPPHAFDPPRPEPVAPVATRPLEGTSSPGRGEAKVLVEPGQGDLLVQLALRLQDRRRPSKILSGVDVVLTDAHEGAASATASTDALHYRGGWERVAGEWPPVERAALTIER
jgi:hypothetical protein